MRVRGGHAVTDFWPCLSKKFHLPTQLKLLSVSASTLKGSKLVRLIGVVKLIELGSEAPASYPAGRQIGC